MLLSADDANVSAHHIYTECAHQTTNMYYSAYLTPVEFQHSSTFVLSTKLVPVLIFFLQFQSNHTVNIQTVHRGAKLHRLICNMKDMCVCFITNITQP